MIRNADLECHEQTFALHEGKAEIDAAGIAIGISIANNLLDLSVDASNEPIRQLFDTSVVSLKVQRQIKF